MTHSCVTSMCHMMKCVAVCCGVLQCVAVCWINESCPIRVSRVIYECVMPHTNKSWHTWMSHTAPCCTTLQHTATHCNTLHHVTHGCHPRMSHTTYECVILRMTNSLHAHTHTNARTHTRTNTRTNTHAGVVCRLHILEGKEF